MRNAKHFGAISVTTIVLITAACTDDTPEAMPPPSSTDTPGAIYRSIPVDPCANADLAALEPLLGPLESEEFSDADPKDGDWISVSGRTQCTGWYHNGEDQTSVQVTLEISREVVGSADSPELNEHNLSWAYTSEEVEESSEQLPEPVRQAINSQWDSAYLWHFPETSDDGAHWDAEGNGLKMLGVYTDSNVLARIYLWKTGNEEAEPPDPESYAEQMNSLANRVFGQLSTDDNN